MWLRCMGAVTWVAMVRICPSGVQSSWEMCLPESSCMTSSGKLCSVSPSSSSSTLPSPATAAAQDVGLRQCAIHRDSE